MTQSRSSLSPANLTKAFLLLAVLTPTVSAQSLSQCQGGCVQRAGCRQWDMNCVCNRARSGNDFLYDAMECSFKTCGNRQADAILGPISGTCNKIRKPIPQNVLAQARRDADRIEKPPKPSEKPPPGTTKPPDPPKPPPSATISRVTTVTKSAQPSKASSSSGPNSTTKAGGNDGGEDVTTSTIDETQILEPTERPDDGTPPVVTVTVTGEDGSPITTLTITGDGSTAIEVRPTTVTGEHPAATGGDGGDVDDGKGPWRANPTDSSPFATVAAIAGGPRQAQPTARGFVGYLWAMALGVVLV